MDTGASNHMTGMLSNLRKYSGPDTVLIGDGSSLPLNDVLLVPNLTKNLLSCKL